MSQFNICISEHLAPLKEQLAKISTESDASSKTTKFENLLKEIRKQQALPRSKWAPALGKGLKQMEDDVRKELKQMEDDVKRWVVLASFKKRIDVIASRISIAQDSSSAADNNIELKELNDKISRDSFILGRLSEEISTYGVCQGLTEQTGTLTKEVKQMQDRIMQMQDRIQQMQDRIKQMQHNIRQKISGYSIENKVNLAPPLMRTQVRYINPQMQTPIGQQTRYF